jgi:ribosomal protein S18 acetylase RimI-like enzyme
VAAALLGAFEQEIMDRVDVYGLSVAKDNPRAIRFYHKMGFELQQETPVSFVFQKRLRPASTA